MGDLVLVNGLLFQLSVRKYRVYVISVSVCDCIWVVNLIVAPLVRGNFFVNNKSLAGWRE